MTYNGWNNYETWCVKLWLDNDPSTYDEAKSIVTCSPSPEDALRDYVETIMWGDEPLASLTTDLLGAALDEVDWHEIARAYTEDLPND